MSIHRWILDAVRKAGAEAIFPLGTVIADTAEKLVRKLNNAVEAQQVSCGVRSCSRLTLGFSVAAIGIAATSPALAQSDLARAYKTISSKQYVDLTHSFSPTSPVWSGFGQAKFSPRSIRRPGAIHDPEGRLSRHLL